LGIYNDAAEGIEMKTQEAIEWFGSRKIMAEWLGIWPHGTYRWGEYPPKLRQFEIERLTSGDLKIEEDNL
tara:strand:- start:592 stop:801 length:210 start_codon:yes stop_codon:yes gene_type:complete